MLHERLHLNMQHVGERQVLGRTVKQLAIGAFERVGRQRLTERSRLHEDSKACQCALGLRRGGEALQGRP